MNPQAGERRGGMTPIIETDVLIVGGGPVGLTLAMDLAQRGIEVTVLELRRRGEPPSVKCNHVAARSMELFRRLGVARKDCAVISRPTNPFPKARLFLVRLSLAAKATWTGLNWLPRPQHFPPAKFPFMSNTGTTGCIRTLLPMILSSA